MKYCLNARQPDRILSQADEIMVYYQDNGLISDLFAKFPSKTVILQIPSGIEIDWERYSKIAKKHDLILCLRDIQLYKECKKYKIKYYWGFPITSYYELKGVTDLGVCQVLIGAPLYFDLSYVKAYQKPIRLVANLCFNDFIPREEGICGTYIRPEDVSQYEKYVDTLEFFSNNDWKKESTLFKIYKQDRGWPGNLNLLLTNLKYNVDNRGIPTEFAAARMQCRQSCMRKGTCKFCYNAMNFSRSLDKLLAEID